jgi:hypothetical protein
MVTSNWSESGAVTGAWIVSDVGSSNGDNHYTSQLNTTSEGEARWYNYNSVIAIGEDPYNPTGEGSTEGIKYNGKIKKNVSGITSSSACNIQASLYNEQGQDTCFNISVLRLNVTANNKATLRDAYHDAIGMHAALGINGVSSPYFDINKTEWVNFIKLTEAAGRLLANLDTMATITVAGKSYTAESLASALFTSINNVENARYKSTATVSFAAIEVNAAGEYVVTNVYDAESYDIVTVESKAYSYGNNVAFIAPDFKGYSVIGYAKGLKASIGQVLGNDYSSLVTNRGASVVENNVTENYLSYTFFYEPAKVSSIVDTNDGKFNYLKAKVSDIPAELGGITYPTYSEHADINTDFNYIIDGNDLTVWSTEKTTAVQEQFMPFYAQLAASTEYVFTYDVTGTDPENVQFSFYNASFTGGNGYEASSYVVGESGQLITTSTLDFFCCVSVVILE